MDVVGNSPVIQHVRKRASRTFDHRESTWYRNADSSSFRGTQQRKTVPYRAGKCTDTPGYDFDGRPSNLIHQLRLREISKSGAGWITPVQVPGSRSRCGVRSSGTIPSRVETHGTSLPIHLVHPLVDPWGPRYHSPREARRNDSEALSS
jgi:hypothetical protein